MTSNRGRRTNHWFN